QQLPRRRLQPEPAHLPAGDAQPRGRDLARPQARPPALAALVGLGLVARTLPRSRIGVRALAAVVVSSPPARTLTASSTHDARVYARVSPDGPRRRAILELDVGVD